MAWDVVVAVVVGTLQGVFEWLPISSEGNVTVALTLLGRPPEAAVSYALFLHFGTALSATAYYREEVRDALAAGKRWWLSGERGLEPAFEGERATLSFVVLATAASSAVGLVAVLGLDALVSELTGAGMVAAVGLLLVGTGLFQRVASARHRASRETPGARDALVVGAVQGLAILPGVSRSGTTTSVLLLRGYDGEAAFRLSFLLSIPAAVLGGAVGVVEAGGVDGVGAVGGVVALATAAAVGYLTIDALMRVVRRVSFWAVCVGLGSLAVVGALLVSAV
jgi:undecaprenyl-diphosphatase